MPPGFGLKIIPEPRIVVANPRGRFAMSDNKKLRESLLIAYGIIRQQTEQICDLHILFIPLLKALEPEYAYLNSLLAAYREAQVREGPALIQSKDASLALVDQAIRHLKED